MIACLEQIISVGLSTGLMLNHTAEEAAFLSNRIDHIEQL